MKSVFFPFSGIDFIFSLSSDMSREREKNFFPSTFPFEKYQISQSKNFPGLHPFRELFSFFSGNRKYFYRSILPTFTSESLWPAIFGLSLKLFIRKSKAGLRD